MRTRTRNTLLRAGTPHGYGPLSVGELLLTENFYISSLLELMCLAEFAGRCPTCGRPGEWSFPDDSEPAPTATARDDQLDRWKGTARLLGRLFDAAREFHGAPTVGKALQLDLHRLASQLEIQSDLAGLRIREITEQIRIADLLTDGLSAFRATMSPREHRLIAERVFCERPATLHSLGQSFGVSRERVRQIQERLKDKLDTAVGSELDILANVVRDHVGAVSTKEEFDGVIAETLPDVGDAAALDLARRMLRSRLGYSELNGLCLDKTASRLVGALRDAAPDLTDDAGLIDAETVRARLASGEWNGTFPQLMTACGFSRIQGRWALRPSIAARTKVALLRIGQPAPKADIAAVAGLNREQVSGALARLETVGRADKRRWGLKEWYEEEYEGVSTMILRRIRRDGGATSLERLREELPRKFGISESSVYTMARAPGFRVQDGLVSLADESTISDSVEPVRDRSARGARGDLTRVRARRRERPPDR